MRPAYAFSRNFPAFPGILASLVNALWSGSDSMIRSCNKAARDGDHLLRQDRSDQVVMLRKTAVVVTWVTVTLSMPNRLLPSLLTSAAPASVCSATNCWLAAEMS